MKEGCVFEVDDSECVVCNLCVDVCLVVDCIMMVELQLGQIDECMGEVVLGDYGNWIMYFNNLVVIVVEQFFLSVLGGENCLGLGGQQFGE